MSETIEISGIEDVVTKLTALSDKAKGELGLKALIEGAEPIRATAMALCPVKTGATRESMEIHKGYKREGEQSVVVGPSARAFSGKTFYAWFVEMGHKLGKRPKKKFFGTSKDTRGEVAPHPFMRPAYEQNKENSVQIVTDVLKAGLNAD